MDATPDHDLAAHVAAWHNRHPLARRITPAQVQGMGIVALPFTAAMGKKNGLLRSAFSEDFIAPLGARRVARFGLRYGTSTRTGPEDWPQRALTVKPGAASANMEVRYLRTAAIDLRNQRTRVLIGGGKKPQVLGQRLWSRPRLAGAAMLFGTVMLAVAAALGRASAPGHEGPLLASAAAASAPAEAAASAPGSRSAAVAASAVPPVATADHSAVATAIDASAPAESAASAHPAPTAASASASPSASPSAPAPTSHAAASTSQPDSAASAAVSARSDTRDIRPALPDDLRAAAKQAARELRASKPERAGTANAAAASSVPAPTSGDGRVFAIATPVTRTRAAAQLRIVLMNAPTDAEPGQARAEVMQVGNGWRTVVWPFNSREAAERTREGLAARGIPAEVIEF